MNFKDQLEADIRDVFLDEDEFAQNHEIDGQEVLCIIDDESKPNANDGVYVIRRHLFVEQSELGYRPMPGQKMSIDDNYFYVVDCIGDGLIEVILEAHES
jgi:hypothetical protein